MAKDENGLTFSNIDYENETDEKLLKILKDCKYNRQIRFECMVELINRLHISKSTVIQ